VRWWLNTDHKRFSVDNAVVSGLDFSELDPDIWMVQWIDGKGEIERQVDPDTNDNGLRETFIDVIPYASYFQQFLELCPLLTLPQAKKVQIDLIEQIFESKRQAPFHYPIAAGDYWWDASDETMGSSVIPAIQNVTATLNATIDKLNALVVNINALAAEINSKIVTGANNGIVTPANSMVAHVNASIVTPTNAALNDFNTFTVGVLNANLIPFINDTLIGVIDGSSNTINNKLQQFNFEALAINAAAPGLGGSIAHIGFGFPATGNFCSAIGDIFTALAAVTAVPWSNQTHVPTSNVQWIPIGETAPVTVTPAEQAAIMQGITARTNDLSIKKNVKIAEVNALTEIQDVIDYDVTTGW
jgi:hypothetical protein